MGLLPVTKQKILKMKILVVDDERAIRNSLKEILMDEGFTVEVASYKKHVPM